jgi:hypothetical protein
MSNNSTDAIAFSHLVSYKVIHQLQALPILLITLVSDTQESEAHFLIGLLLEDNQALIVFSIHSICQCRFYSLERLHDFLHLVLSYDKVNYTLFNYCFHSLEIFHLDFQLLSNLLFNSFVHFLVYFFTREVGHA